MNATVAHMRRILANDLRGLEIEEMDDYEGFKLREGQWTSYTVYLTQRGDWSVYRAIPDIWKGIDAEYEKLIIKEVSAQRAAAALQTDHITYAGNLYKAAPMPNMLPVIYGGIFNDHRE